MAQRYFKFTAAAREARRDYLMQWRKNNPDKVREYNRRYWERRAAVNGKENTKPAHYAGADHRP